MIDLESAGNFIATYFGIP